MSSCLRSTSPAACWWRQTVGMLARAVLSTSCTGTGRRSGSTSTTWTAPRVGVLLRAKTKEALTARTEMFEAHCVEKRYVALTRGRPESSPITIAARLAKDPQRPGRVCAASDGKPSETMVEVVESWACGHALLRAFPKTGRTQQVRVHLAHLGCPVVGDDLYGDGRGLYLSDFKRGYKRRGDKAKPALLGRLALHAESLTFEHPLTHLLLFMEPPLPSDFQVGLKQLRRYGV